MRKGKYGKRWEQGKNTKKIMAEKLNEKLTMRTFYCGDSVWTPVWKTGGEGRFLRCGRISPLFVFSIADQLWMNCGLGMEAQSIPEPGTFLVNAQLPVTLSVPERSVGKPLFY